MTTKVTTVQERLRTVFASTFSTKFEIDDTIDIANNDDNVLDEGWGLVVGQVEESDLQVYCQDRTIHNYAIVLTKWIPFLDHDAETFHDKINELSEDARTVRDTVLDYGQLSIDSSVEIIKHISTSAPQKIEAERGTIIFIEVNFSIEISEAR